MRCFVIRDHYYQLLVPTSWTLAAIKLELPLRLIFVEVESQNKMAGWLHDTIRYVHPC